MLSNAFSNHHVACCLCVPLCVCLVLCVQVPKVSDLIATVSRLRGMYQERIKGEFERLIELSVAEAMSGASHSREPCLSGFKLSATKALCCYRNELISV